MNCLIFILFSICLVTIKSEDKVIDINENILGNQDYKKATFSGDKDTTNHYFKHSVQTIPKAKIGAIRFDFNTFDEKSKQNDVICGFFDDSIVDSELIVKLKSLTKEKSACIGAFKDKGIYDGIVKYDETKKKLGILLVAKGEIDFTATVYVRITEKILATSDKTIDVTENYSLIPVTLVISDFREKASKILFYSYTRELQMYYLDQNTPYPEKLFSGNIMNVYTNPFMVKQKYHGANTMVILTRNFTSDDVNPELFQFEVNLFPSNYLLDYYVSNNPDGRTKNYPLAINMTECTSPYYVVLNYNQPEKKTSLYIDQIYGKLKNMTVAPVLNSIHWEEMLEYDMIEIDIETRKYDLPKFSESHIDVYKIECEIPSLLNFYYIDEKAGIPKLDYGKVAITTLKSKKTATFHFEDGITSPEMTIEIFNPVKLPMVLVDDGQSETMVTENLLIKTMPYNTAKGLIVKERGGDTNTRVIVKIGYNTAQWENVGNNVKYDSETNMFVFYFPNGLDKLNYTYANLRTVGRTTGDNVKYCYGTNIGSAILPSKENCYRVSLENDYYLKVMNPLVMYRDYNYDSSINYYVSIKPVNIEETMNVSAVLTQYNTKERNVEGFGNVVKIDDMEQLSTIITAPAQKNPQIFLQVHQCAENDIEMEITNAYDPTKTIVEKTKVPYSEKNFFIIYDNILLESELTLIGAKSTNVFVKHQGLRKGYSPIPKSGPVNITFNPYMNQLIVQKPIDNYETMKYTVYVDKAGTLGKINLCSIVEGKDLPKYSTSVESYSELISIQINFRKLNYKEGDEFDTIVYVEQMYNSKMVFLSNVLTTTVGEIKQETITEIKDVYSEDNDFVFAKQTATSDDLVFYFSYLQSKVYDVPIGAFSIELSSDMEKGFSDIQCAFVNDGDDEMTMVQAVEEVEDKGNSYCTGGRSTVNKNRYNYIFRYSYTKDNEPRRLVIRMTNLYLQKGEFNVYVRNVDNVRIQKTDFTKEEEYGRQEEYKKTVIPYIVDLKEIRGDDDDYVSKMLIYSQYLEMQMYYLDSTEAIHYPQPLFSGNVMLVYTKGDLAEQKYHAKKLILLSEKLTGQDHSSLGNKFRFHTKMFRSYDQIEYFVSNNQASRTLNRPLNLEMNNCTATNNKYYYILNYGKEEDSRILYIDMVYGSMKKVKIATEVNEDKWSSLVQNKMEVIKDYRYYLINKTQHLDIVEIECETPLLANVYYTEVNPEYSGLTLGDIAIKYIDPQATITITLDDVVDSMFYSVSAFNPTENPNIKFTFGEAEYTLIENAVKSAFLVNIPNSFTVKNNGNSATRIIFKLGYAVDTEWIDEKAEVKGTLYSKDNKFVYRFPKGNDKRNYTNVTINVNSLDVQTVDAQNVKFCFSTSVGMPIYTSLENCFRTGTNIPISLTFINPLISTKNYKDYTDSYYVTLSPYYSTAYIRLDITENKYDVEKRNMEGVATLIVLDKEKEESTILTLPDTTKKNIYVQLSTTGNEIHYNNYKAYNQELIYSGTVKKTEKFHVYKLQNNLMETQIKFTGELEDKIFVKHVGINDYEYSIEDYKVTFDDTKNEINAVKPMKNEPFRITVLVGEKGRFNDYTLCTFAEKDEKEYAKLADYVSSFNSEKSDVVVHFIDFRSFDYHEGDEFDLLIYAVQISNTKFEFLYNVISGKVGKVGGITEIYERIPGKNDYVTGLFERNTTSNYLFYTFTNVHITGEVASIKIKPADGSSLKVSKIGCVFVKKTSDDETMISEVNKAIREGKSVCFGEVETDNNGFDALVNAKDVANSFTRLVIQVMYGFTDEVAEGEKLNITIRTNGIKVTENTEYDDEEELTIIPYVLDLKEIRGDDKKEGYVSKVLLYSTNHEMQMFYFKSGPPQVLFSGNIMFVYTNPKLINEKYSGASTMILLTDSLSVPRKMSLGENFKFKANFFDSKTTIQYYVSANETGRLLNNPTSIEMLSCDQPYYWVLNYNAIEKGDRVIHFDNVFGEAESIKISTQLNDDNWYDFIKNMKLVEGNEYQIKSQKKYHIDALEVKCKTPLLMNVYYTDPEKPKISNLDQGDISIISLDPDQTTKLTFNSGLKGEFIYSFSVRRENDFLPNILITFDEDDELQINKNGIFNRKSDINYPSITITNKQLDGSDPTKVIFKFGYDIEKTFTKIQNDMYQLQDKNRTVNLFAYIFKNGDNRLNFTRVNFTVSTSQSNVKFCYSSNLGTFIDPSLQNCYRVGSDNPYTISLLNPYIMYKSYYTGEDVMQYFVSFRTDDKDHNITIKPILDNYQTKNRNVEGYPNSLKIKENGSTILTRPINNTLYMFVQMEVCTPGKRLSYEFNNAYYKTSLGYKGEISSEDKNTFISIENTNLDTELAFLTDDKDNIKVFVKYLGTNAKYTPIIEKMKLEFNKATKELSITRPTNKKEEIKYTIYIDEKDYLKKQAYTLCSFAEMSKLAHYSVSLNSSNETVVYPINFDSGELEGYESFDILVLAEQTQKGQLMILSDVLQSYLPKGDGTKTALIVILVTLAVVLVAGGTFIYFCLRKFKNKKLENTIVAKPTTLDDISGASQGEKMLDSMAQSQATEKQ